MTVSVIDLPTKQRGTQGSPPKGQRTAVLVSLLRHPISDLDRVFNEVLHPQLELMMRDSSGPRLTLSATEHKACRTAGENQHRIPALYCDC